jgi:hypothetical protein
MIEAMAPVISDQLLARTDEAFTFTFIEEVRGYDGFREHLLCIYSTRLEIALRNRRDHPEVHSRIRTILTALNAVADDEPIYSWTVTTPTRTFGGFSAPSRLIVFDPDIFPNKRNPDDRSASAQL